MIENDLSAGYLEPNSGHLLPDSPLLVEISRRLLKSSRSVRPMRQARFAGLRGMFHSGFLIHIINKEQ